MDARAANLERNKRYSRTPKGRAARARFRERHREELRADRRARIDERRQLIDAHKARPCADCGGEFPPCAMQFDHRPGEVKVADVSRMKVRSEDAILAEIAKCDVVCANCHHLRTCERARG